MRGQYPTGCLQLDRDAVIPDTQITAAEEFGKLCAMGLLSWESCIPDLQAAAKEGGYQGDGIGARTKLAHLIQDATREWELIRGKAERAIRREIQPRIREWQPRAALIAAAWAENERWDTPLLLPEIAGIAKDEVAWWLRGQSGSRRRG